MLLAPAVQFKNAAGTPAYYKEAYEYHCRAARAGDANSQFTLGWLYANGRGVAKDETMAAYMFSKAAEQGHPRAQELLAGTPPSNASQPDLPACLLPDPPPPVVTTASSGSSQDTELAPVDFYPKGGPIFNLVNKLAPRYQIDAALAMAFIAVESGFNAKATSPKNAQGLMQLIPETAKRFRVKNAYNPEDNIKGGLAYLQWLLAFFQGDVELVAAAYNSGEKTVEKYKGVPPYPETRSYVQKISALYRKHTHPFRDDLVQASDMMRMR
jgi:soluble lytic murein transglycosylase-like protein